MGASDDGQGPTVVTATKVGADILHVQWPRFIWPEKVFPTFCPALPRAAKYEAGGKKWSL